MFVDPLRMRPRAWLTTSLPDYFARLQSGVRDTGRPVEYANVEAWLSGLVATMEDGTLELD